MNSGPASLYPDDVAIPSNRAQLWRVVIVLIVVAAGQVLATMIVFPVAALIVSASTGTGFDEALARLSNARSPAAVPLFLVTFAGPIAALAVMSRWLHGVRLRALLGRGSTIDAGDLFRGAGIVFAITGAAFVLSTLAGTLTPNLALSRWLVWVGPVLVSLVIQVTAEELVFRGYLQAALAARFSSMWVWLGVPAVIFGLLHLQPALFGTNAVLVAIAAGLMGLITGHVTARTGNISAAIGLHFANNAYGLLIAGLPGSLSAAALFVQDVDLSDEATLRRMILANIATVLAAYAVFLWTVRRLDAGLKPPAADSK